MSLKMNPGPEKSRKFIRILSWAALGWMLLGLFINRGSEYNSRIFIEIFALVLLDTAFLILTFWKLFFSPQTKRAVLLIFVFFKLVCLGFLAIKLKRLNNPSFSTVGLGVSFIGIAPVLAGLFVGRRGSRTAGGSSDSKNKAE